MPLFTSLYFTLELPVGMPTAIMMLIVMFAEVQDSSKASAVPGLRLAAAQALAASGNP